MKKIPCVFLRDFADRCRPTLLDQVTPECEWVLAGEGIATRKWDGTACAFIGGTLYVRFDCKAGRTPPVGAIPCDAPDPVTGHWPHWVKADRPEDKWARKALSNAGGALVDGTYELCGPKVNGNHEDFGGHVFIRHGADILADCPRMFDGLKTFLEHGTIEGVVFHHPDGRMAKIRRDDYGFEWPIGRDLS